MVCPTGFEPVTYFLAIIGLAFRGLDFPSASEAFANTILLPGRIAGIPAAPWMLACVLDPALSGGRRAPFGLTRSSLPCARLQAQRRIT